MTRTDIICVLPPAEADARLRMAQDERLTNALQHKPTGTQVVIHSTTPPPGDGAGARLAALAFPELDDRLHEHVRRVPGGPGVSSPGVTRCGDRGDQFLDQFDALSRRMYEAGLSIRAE
jgi:hypothetical protein